ncbi:MULTISPECIES: hypothetical protein [unclassified Rhizobium]|uniref:hypothetical protein n=1 Tax=unclassified Rhizobium TaxID=2613769 RepID=UPI001ADA17C2|nr:MULTISPECIES: hypothetical protein [unclassified Rhizobium]MBO9102386.1 hypothetical protein [Rhizobium sp. L58/93]MBO9172150.1 hypothetical protein [Rhizobium sp. L245/93]QXZ88154.1 hypothetical protein J5287_31035 [Rhizobium sp. K1/93]QXZ94328.1 hypothetical protein J5280_30570 [Rhizobium sp. K15/93]QYA05780.1 hypothetical protein J5278_30075 [Rhizobium sp. B21/90]
MISDEATRPNAARLGNVTLQIVRDCTVQFMRSDGNMTECSPHKPGISSVMLPVGSGLEVSGYDPD